MASNLPLNTAYGLSQPLINVFATPIVSTRDPQASDRAQYGTVWVNKSSNDAFVLTSVVAGSATWIGIGGGTGTFTSITVTPGDITVTNGDILITLGDLTLGAGLINAGGSITAGTTVTAGTGITSTTGNIVATAGAVNAGTTMTAGTGITATTGNIVASAGNISATTGTVSAGGVTSGRMIAATGDSGTGFATITSFTNVVDNTQGAGALSLVSASANPGTNTGFLKIYVGLTVAYVPYFTNIAP